MIKQSLITFFLSFFVSLVWADCSLIEMTHDSYFSDITSIANEYNREINIYADNCLQDDAVLFVTQIYVRKDHLKHKEYTQFLVLHELGHLILKHQRLSIAQKHRMTIQEIQKFCYIQEYEADTFAIKQMIKLNYELSGLFQYFSQIKDSESETHPAFKERYQRMYQQYISVKLSQH